MKALHLLYITSIILLLATASFGAELESKFIAREHSKVHTALANLKTNSPGLRSFDDFGLPTRLYGTVLSNGNSPEDAAENFRLNFSEVLGAVPQDLIPISRFNKSLQSLPIMYNQETGQHKFTLVYYTQSRNGIPVFQGELRLLARNESDNPIVLAVSTIRSLGDFKVDPNPIINYELAKASINSAYPALDEFTEAEAVIWAGVEDKHEEPRMALTFSASNEFPERYLFVTDMQTGEILYEENLIIFTDISGVVNGNATMGTAADMCESETITGLPYVRVVKGASEVYADHKGSFYMSNFGSDPVDITSYIWGQFFRVYHHTGSESVITQTVTPPGPVVFTHNSFNTEQPRAEVNAYLHANIIRDMVLESSPNYPAVSTQFEFPIYVNRVDGYCPGNAWYDPGDQSINFCKAGSGYPNTAWQSVVDHEYGHHLVNVAGSGQDQYGEGMGDVVAMMWSDESELGIGFFGTCDEALRDADNSMQYPCSGSSHTCGQLLSACVWDTRNELAAVSQGSEYRDVLRNLVFNSILLHTGSQITPQITIDFLTLDDDDANLDNGTPHYNSICIGFGNHSMDCPELTPLWFDYPNGRPTLAAPDQPTTFEFIAQPGGAAPIASSGQLLYSIDGAPFQTGAITELSTNHYQATLPAVPCGTDLEWYISCDADGFGEITDPKYAPSESYRLIIATSVANQFEDGFETDLGWTSSGGQWGRGAPTGGGGDYGSPDPSSAFAGSNLLGYNLNGDYSNNMSERHMTSPAIDCSDLSGTHLTFQRWLGVEQPDYDHAYVRVSNNGSSWITVWENTGEVTDGSWSEMDLDISAVADNQPTVYIRFTMGTTDVGWTYCGWNIDELQLVGYSCSSGPTPVIIETESVPDWTEGQAYSQLLAVSGGSGVYQWQDKLGDLVGTGLTLSIDGLLSGSPTSAGIISFTAEVTDDQSGSDEQVITFSINPLPSVTTLSLPDWTVGVPYSQQLIGSGGTGALSWSDKNGDLSGSGLSLASGGLLSGTPSNSGVANFTAELSDQVGASGEKPLSILVNPAVTILSDGALPEGSTGLGYSIQLQSDGGTGAHTWAQLGTGLSGTGLALSSAGLLTGTPTDTGLITFTARALDAVGGSADKEFSFTVVIPYMCGDANGDDILNVGDAVFMINFVFNGGASPDPIESGDANCDDFRNVADAVYLINFVFKQGDAPCCP